MSKIANGFSVGIINAAVALATHDIAGIKVGASLTEALKAAYTGLKTQAEFLAFFGSGGNNKLPTFVQGSLFADMAKAISRYSKEKQALIKKMITTRTKEARAIRNKGVVLDDGQSVQVAFTAMRKKEKGAPVPKMPETPVDTDWTNLGKTASMEDIANLVSAYVAHHGQTACRALAGQLRDFMPITVQKAKQA